MSDGLRRYPFLQLLLPLVAGIVCGDTRPYVFSGWVCGMFFLSVLLTFCLHRFRHLRWLYGTAVFLFFFGLGVQLISCKVEETAYAFSGSSSVYKVRIQEKPEEKERSILCRSVLLGEYRQDTVACCLNTPLFLLYFQKDSLAATLRRGDELWVHTTLSPPTNNGNPDEFDYVRYLHHKGCTGTAYVAAGHWKLEKHTDTRTLLHAALDIRAKVVDLYRTLGFDGDELAVLSALTVGDKEELSDDIRETYSVSGASHVLALSGLHVGFLYALCWFLFAPLWKRWGRLKPLLLLMLVGLLWGFAFLTGLSASVVRSVIMFSLLALASLQPEGGLKLNTVAATAFLMLLFCPEWLFDVGFQLSFAAVTSILLFYPRLYALWKVKNPILRRVWGLMSVSIVAQLGAAPLVMLYFHNFSTHFLLTNLFVIPIVSVVMYAAVLLLLLTPFPFVQQAFAPVVNTLIQFQNAGLRWIEHLPYASVDGIWTNVYEVLLFYLLLLTIHRIQLRNWVRNVYTSLGVLLLLLLVHTISTVTSAPCRSIVFYNVSRCPSVHCLTNGNTSWLVCADSLPNIARLHQAVSPYWYHLHLDAPHMVTNAYEDADFSFSDGIISYSGKRICLLTDDRWRNKKNSHPLSVDYLYISRGYRGGVGEISSLFTVGTVVLDGSLSTSRQHKLLQECNSLGISCLSLSERGAVRVVL